ncbi:unnamed protein product [Schistosoma curassoni]|nr:unnamed protein product [Schistosoma curassoni]
MFEYVTYKLSASGSDSKIVLTLALLTHTNLHVRVEPELPSGQTQAATESLKWRTEKFSILLLKMNLAAMMTFVGNEENQIFEPHQ